MSYYQDDGQKPVYKTTRGAKDPGGCGLWILGVIFIAVVGLLTLTGCAEPQAPTANRTVATAAAPTPSPTSTTTTEAPSPTTTTTTATPAPPPPPPATTAPAPKPSPKVTPKAAPKQTTAAPAPKPAPAPVSGSLGGFPVHYAPYPGSPGAWGMTVCKGSDIQIWINPNGKPSYAKPHELTHALGCRAGRPASERVADAGARLQGYTGTIFTSPTEADYAAARSLLGR